MPATLKLDDLPPNHRDGFARFARHLQAVFGDNLIGLSAYGGWLLGDGAAVVAPAASVAVLREIDLEQLAKLAADGERLAKQCGVQAPLIMTPAYIKASCDSFPLEFLEIRQSDVTILGDDLFTRLEFDPRDVRMQCERELKSALIQLRQGLLAAAGDESKLADVCAGVTTKVVRVLRGVLHLRRPQQEVRGAATVVADASQLTGLAFETIRRQVSVGDELGLEGFKRLYAEVAGLSDVVDRMEIAATA